MKGLFLSVVLVISLVVSHPAFAQTNGRPVTLPAQSHAGVDHGSTGKTMASSAKTEHQKSGTGKTEHAPKLTVKSKATSVSDNKALADKLQLIVGDVDLHSIAGDFKNLGQLVAAVHVSHNLGIDFLEFKDRMLGEKLSMGETIKSFKTELSEETVTVEVKKAENQAKDDIKTSH